MTQQITAWSFSRYSTHDGCPFKAKRLYIDKVKMEFNVYMDRGTQVHKLGEDYLNNKLKQLPVAYEKFKKEMLFLKSKGAVPEEQWTFTKDWWPTGWFDFDAWLRIKIDVQLLQGTHLDIIDFKTGKMRDGYMEQLDLYAGGGFALFDGLKTITTKLFYLDSGDLLEENYTIKDAPKLIRSWNARVKPMLKDKNFIPNPTYFCKYCQFRKKGGDQSCRY